MHPDKIPKLLYELIKNSRRSDRDLAKALGFSQPTVTRTRKKLEDDEFILQYTALPDLTKLGFEIAAFTFFQLEPNIKPPHEWLRKDPRVIFAAEGDGLNGKNSVVVTIHKNYTGYSNFMSDLQQEANPRTANSFMLTIVNIKKRLNFVDLQKAL